MCPSIVICERGNTSAACLQLLEQRPVCRPHDVLAAREREPHEPDDHAIAFARHARLVALEHVLDRRELLADPRLGLEPLHERHALLRYAAEPLVEVANLFLELADARARVGEIALGLRGLLAQAFDVRDELRDDGLDALVELRDLVRRRADVRERLLVAQDQVLERLVLVAAAGR